MTLTEIMIASTLAVLVVIGIGQVDVTRVRLAEDIRQRSGVTSPNRLLASIAALQIAQHLERADRLLLSQDGISAGQLDTDVFFRVPIVGTPQAVDQGSCTLCQGSATTPPNPCCFDIAANYRWDEFRLNKSSGELKLYTNIRAADGTANCSNVTTLVLGDVASFVVQYQNEGTLAPGATPPTGTNLIAPNNNNVLRYAIESVWSDVQGTSHSQVFPGEVTIRGAGYTNAPLGNQNPALADVSPPPAASCGP